MSTRQPSQQIAQRDRQVLDHLLSIADSEGRLSCSTYAIACELGLHRQTLSRILRRLAKTGTVTLDHHACTPIRVTDGETKGVTAEAEDVTPPTTEVPTGAIISWTVTYSLSYQPGYVMGQPKDVTISDCNVAVSDDNKETKQKNEEIPPAPPKEEKKQKKENNTHTNVHACEKNHPCFDKKTPRIILHFAWFTLNLQPKDTTGRGLVQKLQQTAASTTI